MTNKSFVPRWLLWLGGILAVLVIAGIVGLNFATKALKGEIEKALGPNGEVSEIRAGLSSIEIIGIRIKPSAGWPGPEELSAKRVIIKPDLAALFSKSIRVSQIRIEDAYLAMYRRKDGKFLVLPSLLGAAKEGADEEKKESSGSTPKVIIDGVTLANSAVEFYDGSVRQPPVKIRLEQANLQIGTLVLPDLTGKTSLQLDGVVKGIQRDGKISAKGNVEIASKDSDLTAQLRGVDLVTFQPYLIKASDTGVKKGWLDLDLKSTVQKNQLHAPGTLTLADLELSGNSFMGMPASAMVGLMKNKQGKITVNFALDGNINDPKFSLNESLSKSIGTSMASVAGVSIEGLAKGIGSVGSSAAKGVGDTMGKLFGKQK